MSGNIIGFDWEIRKLAFWKLSILDLICCPGVYFPDLVYPRPGERDCSYQWGSAVRRYCGSIRGACSSPCPRGTTCPSRPWCPAGTACSWRPCGECTIYSCRIYANVLDPSDSTFQLVYNWVHVEPDWLEFYKGSKLTTDEPIKTIIQLGPGQYSRPVKMLLTEDEIRGLYNFSQVCNTIY